MNRIVAVVVTYESEKEIGTCLAALEAQQGVDCTIVVVDNASSDHTLEIVRRDFPRVETIANDRNLGFGRANNQVLLAAGAAAAEWFAIVNPDATLPPGALAACSQILDSHPEVGIVGLSHTSPDGAFQPSAFPFLSLGVLVREVLFLRPAFQQPIAASDVAVDVDWVQGSFLAVRGAALRAAGGFDPEFFMYGEDMEWCWRIRQAGYRIVWLSSPSVEHAGGASTGGELPRLFVEHLKGRVRFFRKHRGGVRSLVARVLIALSVLPRWALRETQVLAYRLSGRRPSATLEERLRIFREAARWVAMGQPVGPAATPKTSA